MKKEKISLKDDIIFPGLIGMGMAALVIGLAAFDAPPVTETTNYIAPARIEVIEETLETYEVETQPELANLGIFRITYYCPCKACTGDGDGITKTGTIATAGKTIGVDPEVIPLGTTVIIDGHEYIAEDTGSGIHGNEIDLFVSSHDEALENGVDYKEVWVYGN